jgi:hypothetical protein
MDFRAFRNIPNPQLPAGHTNNAKTNWDGDARKTAFGPLANKTDSSLAKPAVSQRDKQDPNRKLTTSSGGSSHAEQRKAYLDGLHAQLSTSRFGKFGFAPGNHPLDQHPGRKGNGNGGGEGMA